MPPTETATLYAGDATVVEDATDRREYRGRVVVLSKPDGTVLVHDATGYQPVAWLTRADAVTVTDDDAFRVTAHDERADDWLRVTGHPPRDENGVLDATLAGHYPIGGAGRPLGRCPSCDGALVDRGGAVACVHCGVEHGYPDDATIRAQTPGNSATHTAGGDADTPGTCACGLPKMRIERGAVIDCCVDRNCERLDAHVRDHLDREHDCPACDGALVVERERGLFLACEHRPDCDTAFYVPSGVEDGTCNCGLPAFALGSGRRCLDATCDAM